MTTPTETETATADTLYLDPGDLRPAGNPRKKFDEDRLAELKSSIRQHGLINPVTVREDPAGPSGYLIIAGERRWRAATDIIAEGAKDPAGPLPGETELLEEGLFCKLKNVTADQAREIALIENLQREDLDPVEEAEAIRDLLTLMDAAELARRLSRSSRAIYNSVKILGAPAGIQEAVSAGTVRPRVARAIASIPHEGLKGKAAAKILSEPDLPALQAVQLVEEEFRPRLKTAPFDPTDPALIEARPDCGICPHNTASTTADITGTSRGNAPAYCTDPACYRVKARAHRDKILRGHREASIEGMTAADLEEAEAVTSEYVRTDRDIPAGSLKPSAAARKKKWRWDDLAKNAAGEWTLPVRYHLPENARRPVYYASKIDLAAISKSGKLDSVPRPPAGASPEKIAAFEENLARLRASAENLGALDILRPRAVSERSVEGKTAQDSKSADEFALHTALNAASTAALASADTFRAHLRHIFRSALDQADPWLLGFLLVRVSKDEDPKATGSDADRYQAITDRHDYLLAAGHLHAADVLANEVILLLLAALAAGDSPTAKLSETPPIKALAAPAEPEPETLPSE